MLPIVALCAIQVCLLPSGYARQSSGPPSAGCLRFGCYPARVVFRGRPAKPRFKTEDNFPHFREDVQFALRKGPTFAGAQTLVEVACGTGCAAIAVVDNRTGEIFRNTPFGEVHFGTPVNPYGKISYRLNSRLLVIEGRIDGVSKTPVRAYYEWCDPGLRLLQAVPIGPR